MIFYGDLEGWEMQPGDFSLGEVPKKNGISEKGEMLWEWAASTQIFLDSSSNDGVVSTKRVVQQTLTNVLGMLGTYWQGPCPIFFGDAWINFIIIKFLDVSRCF